MIFIIQAPITEYLTLTGIFRIHRGNLHPWPVSKISTIWDFGTTLEILLDYRYDENGEHIVWCHNMSPLSHASMYVG